MLAWVRAQRDAGLPLTVLAADEKGDVDVADENLTGPTLVVIGNEASGLSEAWRATCDRITRIPITGSASSLNAASAATVLLYEAARSVPGAASVLRLAQRHHDRPRRPRMLSGRPGPAHIETGCCCTGKEPNGTEGT